MLTSGYPAPRPRRYSNVRAVSQIELRLQRESSDPFLSVQGEALKWIERKAGKVLSEAAWKGLSFELDDVGAQHVAAAHLDEPRYWAARVDDADRVVPQRTWTIEIGLAATPKDVVFGCRLMVSARGENPPYQPSIPAFVRDVVRTGGAFLDGRPLSMEPWIVRSEEDVADLCRLLRNKSRRTDVCVFSLAADSVDPQGTSASAAAVHEKTLGAAHIIILTGPAAYALTDLVGKEFSVFNRAIRTYRPGFDVDTDDPIRHPIAMAQSVAAWQENGLEGAEAFESFLIRTAIAQTVARADLERLLPPFSEVRRIATTFRIDNARDAGASLNELLKLYEEDNSKLRLALDEEKALHAGLLLEADRERDDAQRRAEESEGEVFRLHQRIRALEAQFESREAPSVELPTALDRFKEWADKSLAGSVFITNRALRGAKESDYEDPVLVYRALLLLRDRYVPMRRKGGDALAKAYYEGLRDLGLEEAASITPSRRGEQGDEYLVQYDGRKRELDRHFKKGSSRESRHCFRLYFFWDDKQEQVVVGWLTSHLDTRET